MRGFCISCLGMHKHVAEPNDARHAASRHQAFADWALRRFRRLLNPFFAFLDIPTRGFHDLTRAELPGVQRGRPRPDPGVRYFLSRRPTRWPLPPIRSGCCRTMWCCSTKAPMTASCPSSRPATAKQLTSGMATTSGLVNWGHILGTRRLPADPTAEYAKLVQRLADVGC